MLLFRALRQQELDHVVPSRVAQRTQKCGDGGALQATPVVQHVAVGGARVVAAA